VIPVLLDGGISLLPRPADRDEAQAEETPDYEKTGTVGLAYDIVPK